MEPTCDTDDLSRFNVYVRREFDMPEFDDVFYRDVQARHRHGTMHAIVMSVDAWRELEPLSLVPIPNCTNIVVTEKGVPATSANGVCHVGTLASALRACASFQSVDMVFVLGDLTLEASTHFADGIDYVYVQTPSVPLTLPTASGQPWYCDGETFESLSPTLYAGRTRHATVRTLTPWVIQQLDGEPDQAQYNRVLATVIRNGVFDCSACTYTQAGIRLHFALTSTAGRRHIPVLHTDMDTDTGVDAEFVARNLYDDCIRRLVPGVPPARVTDVFLKEELGVTPFFCVTAGVMACTVIVHSGSIDAVCIAAIAIAIHVEAARLRVVPCHLTLVYPVVALPAHNEAQCLGRIAAKSHDDDRVSDVMSVVDAHVATLK